ncbi:hypothetical protein ACHQM5_002600 [Ranunculus cassubicifolius]
MLPIIDEDPPDHPAAFSIRDYVFTTRHSHLENNWPFSQPPFSTHEIIKDLLPPFEPPNSIRTHLLLSSSMASKHAQNKPPTNCTFILTHSMAASNKLCPVCKIFSSSSNTTLNAHIDQCLAIQPCLTNKVLHQHSIKPTKRRSMVDIYATAPRCTLEELDIRNGSNWAADVCLLTAADDKTQRSSQLDNHKCKDDEYPVYVDSNGTKLRIISKFMPTAEDNTKASKALPFQAEKHCQPKYIKSKPRNKNLCSLESNEIGMSMARDAKHGMENGYDKEESASQLSKSRNEVKCSNPETLTHWVCSKRTSRLKRASGKGNHLDLGLSSSKSTNASIERNKRDCDDFSFGESCIMSNPSENASSFPNARYAKSPHYESQVESHNRHENNPFSRKRTSSQRGGSLLTFPKPLGAFTTCPSKGVQVDAVATDSSDTFLKKSVLCTEFAVKSSHSDLVSKLNGKQSAIRKPRMRRYTEMDRQLGTKVLNVDSAEYLTEMGETCHFERSSDKGNNSFAGLEVLKIPVDTKDASHAGRQRWDLDVGATMKSQPVGISSSDSQWRSCRVDPPALLAAPGSNKILSTQDRNMVVDGDSSTSPISAISILSHPTVQRSNSQLSEIESFVKPCEDPDCPVMDTWRSDRISFNGESCEGATAISPSEESVKMNDDQPCCCFLRWASSFDAFPTYEDPQLLKQCTTRASQTHAKGKQQMAYTTTSIESLSPVSRISDMVTPTYQSPRGSVSGHSSPDVLHNREAQDAQSVLRLMGKNLVVVNKDVNHWQPSPDSPNTSFADSSTKHTNRLRLSPGHISESAGVSSQDSCNPQQRRREHMGTASIDPSLMRNCLKSVQTQHRSQEVIVIDDCLESEAELSSRMKSYFSQPSPADILPPTVQMGFFPFHPCPASHLGKWGDTLRGGQVTFLNSFAS